MNNNILNIRCIDLIHNYQAWYYYEVSLHVERTVRNFNCELLHGMIGPHLDFHLKQRQTMFME